MEMKKPCSDYTLERWLAIILSLLFLLPWLARAEEPCGAAIQLPLHTIDAAYRDPMLVDRPIDTAFADALSERIALRAREYDARVKRGRFGFRETTATRYASVVAVDTIEPSNAVARSAPATVPDDLRGNVIGDARLALPAEKTPPSLAGVGGLLLLLGGALVAISPRVA